MPMPSRRSLAALGFAALLPLGCAPRLATAVAPVALAPLTHTTWVTRSAEFPALTRQVYAQAAAAIERAASEKASSSWGVILDADETVISNVQFQLELERNGQTYTPALWNTWTRRREATAIPGAQPFLQRMRALGGRIAIVTNRLESECADTRANLVALSLVFDVMLCRPDGGPSDKNLRFAIAAAGAWQDSPRPLEVLAWIGDNILDFPAQAQSIRLLGDDAFSAFGTRFFLLPNPMYGSWQ